jgi:hypothetical protein
MATPKKKKGTSKKAAPKSKAKTLPVRNSKNTALDGSISLGGKKVPTSASNKTPKAPVPAEPRIPTEPTTFIRSSQEVVDAGFKQIALGSLADDVLDKMKSTVFAVKRTEVAVECQECDRQIKIIAVYHPNENKIVYDCPKCEAKDVEEHNWFTQKMNGDLVNPWTDEVITQENYDAQFALVPEDVSEEVSCKVCGFPNWWADNDCTACGGMSYEDAQKDIQPTTNRIQGVLPCPPECCIQVGMFAGCTPDHVHQWCRTHEPPKFPYPPDTGLPSRITFG